MMAALDDAGIPTTKRHFACDSFQGLPRGTRFDWSAYNNCSVAARSISGAQGCGYARGSGVREAQTLRQFQGQYAFARRIFEARVLRSGVSPSRMVVVEGWFNQTLPPASLGRIAFARFDGDLYESTRDALNALYPLVSSGGAVYIDDYGAYGGCQLAVDEYRQKHSINTPMHKVWQAFTPIARAFATPQMRAGFGFEAVWWIKE